VQYSQSDEQQQCSGSSLLLSTIVPGFTRLDQPEMRALMNPYHAIADPYRRQMLDLLRTQGPLRAGEIVAHFPKISQPAVSKHLRVLRQASLVRSTRTGREQWYQLDAAPLQLVAQWLEEYESLWSHRLERLRHVAEQTVPKTETRGEARESE
jgi:DNA-binding transcriptional ArsR family regulator